MNLRQIAALVQADVPVNLWGPPGGGKTKLTAALFRALGLKQHVEILSQCDPTDFGVPREQDGRIIRMPLDWIVKASQEPWGIFLDEFPLAPRSVLAATLTFVQDREIAGCKLHADTRIILASNGTEFTGVDLLPQQANRMAHVDFEQVVPLADWVRGLIAGFPDPSLPTLPKTWTSLVPKHRALIASFVTRMPTEAFRMPKDLGKAWPSRRTWDMVATASAACEAINEDDALPAGALVGDGPALAYMGWRAQQDIPEPEAVLAAASTFPLPSEDDKLFVVLSACAGAAVAKPDGVKWNNCWTLCGRAAKMGRADIGTVAARVLAENAPKGVRPPKIAEELIPILRAAGN